MDNQDTHPHRWTSPRAPGRAPYCATCGALVTGEPFDEAPFSSLTHRAKLEIAAEVATAIFGADVEDSLEALEDPGFRDYVEGALLDEASKGRWEGGYSPSEIRDHLGHKVGACVRLSEGCGTLRDLDTLVRAGIVDAARPQSDPKVEATQVALTALHRLAVLLSLDWDEVERLQLELLSQVEKEVAP